VAKLNPKPYEIGIKLQTKKKKKKIIQELFSPVIDEP
jgi:hypothetical protein